MRKREHTKRQGKFFRSSLYLCKCKIHVLETFPFESVRIIIQKIQIQIAFILNDAKKRKKMYETRKAEQLIQHMKKLVEKGVK